MKNQKLEERIAKLHGKEEYVIHKRNLKEASNHGLIVKKLQRVKKFNQETWLKSYTELRNWFQVDY